jgi:bud site selection protein 31
MPKIRRTRKKPPAGWDLIEPTINEFDERMKEGTTVAK